MKSRRGLTYTLFGIALLLVAVAAGARPNTPQPTPAPIVAAPPPAPAKVVVANPEPAPPEPPVIVKQTEAPQIEVVFALDTTSSMTGLIDGAKRKIWSLVNFISSGQPRPHVRIGLVAYRDVGDEYVTRFYDLNDDLDEVFEHLRHFRADGGGDTPEHVAKALHDAVERTSWTSGDKVAHIIYLVGDAPPHFDYQDGFDVNAIARRAAKNGIHVNTIRCGDDPETGQAWRKIASLGAGQYATVNQTGGVADITTPFDDKLAALNKRLLGTTIAYGSHAAALRAKIAAVSAAAPAAIADRATFAAGSGHAISGEGDLVSHLGEGGKGFSLAQIKDAELPAEMQVMKPADREEYVAKKAKERDEVMAEIRDVARRRDAFAAHKAAAAPIAADKRGFDDHVKASLKAETAGMVAY